MSEEFRKSAQRWAVFEEYCGTLNASIYSLSSSLATKENVSSEDKLTQLARMRDCAQQVAKIDAEAKAQSRMAKKLSTFASEVTQGRPDRNIETFKAAYEEGQRQVVAFRDQNTDKNQELKKIEQVIRSVNPEEQEHDLQIVVGAGSQQPTRCPVLNCELERPVVNTQCGHSYSLKGAITFLCQRNSYRGSMPERLEDVPMAFSARCPVAQCESQIRRDCLRRDYAMEQTQRQLQSSSGRISMDVEDLV